MALEFKCFKLGHKKRWTCIDCEMGLFPDEKSLPKTKWHFDSKWGHSLSLWQLTALLCQLVTYFPIWCLVTVSFIFIQLWIRGRAYVVSPCAIMWNVVWGRGAECPAAQIRPTEQTSSLIVPSTHLIIIAPGIERQGARKGQTGFILAKSRARGISRVREG